MERQKRRSRSCQTKNDSQSRRADSRRDVQPVQREVRWGEVPGDTSQKRSSSRHDEHDQGNHRQSGRALRLSRASSRT